MAAPTEKSRIITAFVLDFETGGLDPQKSAATQLSIHAVRIDTFEVLATFNHYFYPYDKRDVLGKKRKVLKSKYDEDEPEPMEYSDKALEYSAITMDLLKAEGESIDDVCAQIIEFFKANTFQVKASEKPFIVGQNILFDLGFLQQILVYTDHWKEFAKIVRGVNDFWGNFQPYYVDTILFSQLALCHLKVAESWKLELVAEMLGIELDDAHDADADVTATRDNLRVLTQRMRNVDGSTGGSDCIVETKKVKKREHFKI